MRSEWPVPPGWALFFQPVTDSTNDDAKQAALGGQSGPAVFLADVQKAGRGRYGRRWIAPAGSSLLLSLLLRSPVEPIDLTALCSVSLVQTLEALTGIVARIKWPNDIMVGERKVCGVLTEVVWQRPPATVVGMGLNVNMDPAAAGLPPTATSLSSELGRALSREAIFQELLRHIDGALADPPERLVPRIRRQWEELLWRRSQKVRIAEGGAEVEGVVEGLSASGALRVRDAAGSILEIATGEVLL